MSKRPLNLTSHTELSTLAQCEMKWHLRYREGIRGDDTPALIMGRLIDRATGAFWSHGSWQAELADAIVENGLAEMPPDLSFLDDAGDELELAARAYWLMQRYERHYRPLGEVEKIRSIGQQLDLRAPIPGTKQNHQAIVDEVWEDQDGYRWMVERKTYGRNDSIKLVHVMPQLTLNLWVVQQHYERVAGIVYDGIYTYRWKAQKPTQKELLEEAIANDFEVVNWGTHLKLANLKAADQRAWAKAEVERHPGVDRPDSDSFTMLWLDRTGEQIDKALVDVRAGVRRREALRRGAAPMRNIGPLCNNCGAQAECFGRLAFSTEIELSDMEGA